jgi:hypothetical protein
MKRSRGDPPRKGKSPDGQSELILKGSTEVSPDKYSESPSDANWRSILDPSLIVPEHLAGPISDVRFAWNCLATPEMHAVGKNALLQAKRAILSSSLPQEEMRQRWIECLPGRIRTLQRTADALPRLAARLGLESLDHIAAQLRAIRERYEREAA